MRPFRPRNRSGGPADTASPVVPRTAGVVIARDALDILPLVVAHHLRIGLERIHVIDDGSSDGSWEFLVEISRRSGRVTHHRVLSEDDPQLETVTEACNQLIAEGARLVVPFDADEFWDLTPELLGTWVRDERPRALSSQWVNFAQARENSYPRPHGLLDVRYRAQIDPAATEEAVSAFAASFLQYGPIPKTLVWSSEPIAFGKGQHHVQRLDGTGLDLEPAGVDVLHVPLRWRSELTKRALNYEPRRARRRTGPGDSWQSLFHLAAVADGRDEEVWAATSADEAGCLDVYGSPVPLVPDDRVRDAVRQAGELLDAMGLPVP